MHRVTAGVPFVKGHGTENDFILLPDETGTLQISKAQVRALCDRRAGLGADGVIRVVRAAAPQTGFVMDYRNADGSLAEMCGNGARLFARYLVEAGLEGTGTFDFVTRGGVRTATVGAEGDVTVSMGAVTIGAQAEAELGGTVYPATAVDVGNPHMVCLLDPDPAPEPDPDPDTDPDEVAGAELEHLDLTQAPTFDHDLFPAGVNVEFVVPVSADHIRMRVFERGVGETRSCGTGTVAAAAAFAAARGVGVTTLRVDVPGGSVVVTLSADEATLTGPAVLVAAGTIDQEFWDSHR